MKKIMILGAGTYQVPLIRTAKRMGLYTIVISIPGDYRGFELADKVYYIDTRDSEKVLEVAKAEQIDGICTSGTDVAVATIGYVCEKMNLSGISLNAARVLTDKVLMKNAFLDGGVAVSKGKGIRSVDEARKVADEIGYPVVVKRVDGSGSRGITVVKDLSQIEEAFHHAMDKTQKDYVLIEGFIKGNEIGVDGFVQNGELVFLAPHGKFIYHGKQTDIPVGHSFPYECSNKLRNEIHTQMQKAVTASGANNCSVNADVFIDGDNVSIIEMGGRTGATCIPELISIHYGFDFYEKMIQSALGHDVSFINKGAKPCMAKLLMSPVGGKITALNSDEIDMLHNENVLIELDYALGHNVFAMSDGTDRIGHVIATVETEKELDEIISRVRNCIEIDGQSLEEIWNG